MRPIFVVMARERTRRVSMPGIHSVYKSLRGRRRPPRPESASNEEAALAVLEPRPAVAGCEIRARSKDLCKRLHPCQWAATRRLGHFKLVTMLWPRESGGGCGQLMIPTVRGNVGRVRTSVL